jgi:hypothetical protein
MAGGVSTGSVGVGVGAGSAGCSGGGAGSHAASISATAAMKKPVRFMLSPHLKTWSRCQRVWPAPTATNLQMQSQSVTSNTVPRPDFHYLFRRRH